MLLVVSDMEDVSVDLIPWETIDGILLVALGPKPHRETKFLLKSACNQRFIDFNQMFIVPPIRTEVSQETLDMILQGCGLVHSKDVVLYGSIGSTRHQHL